MLNPLQKKYRWRVLATSGFRYTPDLLLPQYFGALRHRVLPVWAVAIGVATIAFSAIGGTGTIAKGSAVTIGIALAFVKFAPAILARCALSGSAAVTIEAFLSAAVATFDLCRLCPLALAAAVALLRKCWCRKRNRRENRR